MSTGAWPLWEVFVRARRGLSHVHAGSLRDQGRTTLTDLTRPYLPDVGQSGERWTYVSWDGYSGYAGVLLAVGAAAAVNLF